jgi:hypothetical protein
MRLHNSKPRAPRRRPQVATHRPLASGRPDSAQAPVGVDALCPSCGARGLRGWPGLDAGDGGLRVACPRCGFSSSGPGQHPPAKASSTAG